MRSIPHRMAFWHKGPPMSWLRRQTITTFCRLNPSWDVELWTDRPVYDLPKRVKIRADATLNPTLKIDTQADQWRWRWLHDVGGWAADTDIVWLQPMPEWEGVALTTDGGTPGPLGLSFAIGLVGAEPGARFTADCMRLSDRATAADHQSAGTGLLAKEYGKGISGLDQIKCLPAALLYPYGFSARKVARCWEAGAPLPEGLLGLHWGGGHTASQVYQWHMAPQSPMFPGDCPVVRAMLAHVEATRHQPQIWTPGVK